MRVTRYRRWHLWFILGLWLPCLAQPHRLWGDAQGEQVAVIYNTALAESKQVAEYYAQRRQVPESQVLGFRLPAGETMTRKDYRELLEKPLWNILVERKLFVVRNGWDAPGQGVFPAGSRVQEATVRYAALCYGVPTRIVEDGNLSEEAADQMQVELRRNEASVDSELVCLPLANRRLTGPIPNPLAGATNASLLHPTNGLWLVGRLDGPSAAVAKGLVDKAMEAETNGLWGRAYFDARGLTEGHYKLGDEWIQTSARLTRRMGFETVLDENPDTFSVGFPMSQIAFYAGWYDGTVSGPFTRPEVEFMPGAIAYHLHSFSAQVLRTDKAHWVGPLLAKGATATMGSVAEPYLVGTPDLEAFFSRVIILRFSLAEAAWTAQNLLSWQTIVVGDPLYRPFRLPPPVLHQDLTDRQSRLIEWSHLRIVDLNLATGADADGALAYLSQVPLTRRSAILTEKAADLYYEKKQLSDALRTYERVLELSPSPQQKARVQLTVSKLLSYLGRTEKACDVYEQLLKEGYPEPLEIYQKLALLAEDLGQQERIDRYQREIRRLSGGRSN